MRLIDAARCPYCARVRIALAEKRIDYETVEIDLHRLVLDSLLGERDPNARAVRAAIGVVKSDHRSILASSPSTSAT